MAPILEGNELEKKFDNGAGEVILDVDHHGSVKFSLSYQKDLGMAKVKNISELESNIFKIGEEISKKTGVKWDDAAFATMKALLGIVGMAPEAEAAPVAVVVEAPAAPAADAPPPAVL